MKRPSLRLGLGVLLTVVLAGIAVQPALSDTPTCTQTVTGFVPGALGIGAGVTCINGGTVAGPVTVSAGAAVILTGATIYGPLTATGAAQVAVCDSTIAGPVSVSGSSGSVRIGSAADGSPACGGNTILGPVNLTGNSGGAELGANTVAGGVTLTGNSGRPEVVAANTIEGPLSCAANNPNPTDNGQLNTVHGPASGQCVPGSLVPPPMDRAFCAPAGPLTFGQCFIPGRLDLDFDASSGPLGQNPTGTFLFESLPAHWGGNITCLQVTGNVASIGGVITDSIGPPVGSGFSFTVTDNGPGAPDALSFFTFPQSPPTADTPDCGSMFANFPRQGLIGDMVVEDQ